MKPERHLKATTSQQGLPDIFWAFQPIHNPISRSVNEENKCKLHECSQLFLPIIFIRTLGKEWTKHKRTGYAKTWKLQLAWLHWWSDLQQFSRGKSTPHPAPELMYWYAIDSNWLASNKNGSVYFYFLFMKRNHNNYSRVRTQSSQIWFLLFQFL